MPFVGPPDDTTQHLADNSSRQLNQAFDLPTGMMFVTNLYAYYL
jgi:hypothetical protein